MTLVITPVVGIGAKGNRSAGIDFSYYPGTGADAVVFVTEWNEFRDLDLDKMKSLMKANIVIDCRNIYEPPRMKELEFKYHSVGRLPAGD